MINPSDVIIVAIHPPIDDVVPTYIVETSVGVFRLTVFGIEISMYHNNVGGSYQQALSHLLGERLKEAIENQNMQLPK